MHVLFYLKQLFYLSYLVYDQNQCFFTKLVISFLLAKYACANLAGNFSAADLLNSGLVIHIVWSDILFSIAVRVLVAAKLLILGVLPLT